MNDKDYIYSDEFKQKFGDWGKAKRVKKLMKIIQD